jgi:hypothetical protein
MVPVINRETQSTVVVIQEERIQQDYVTTNFSTTAQQNITYQR